MDDSIELRAVKIAAEIMQENGVCRYDSPTKCRMEFADEKTCRKCIEKYLLSKARKQNKGKDVKHFAVTYQSGVTRDTQVWKGNPDDASPYNEDHWEEVTGAEVFAGVYPGETEADAIAAAAAAEGCHPGCLKVIGVLQ